MPDENVSFNLTAIPAALRICRDEGIDVVITTSPPGSVHFVGAACKRQAKVRWVADLRDSLVAHPHRDAQRLAVRVKEQGHHMVARLIASQADAIVAVSDAIADEMRALGPKGPVQTIANGSDFDDFAGLEYSGRTLRAGRAAVPDHARGLVLRQARPEAVPDRAVAGRRRDGAVPRRLPRRRSRMGRRASPTASS